MEGFETLKGITKEKVNSFSYEDLKALYQKLAEERHEIEIRNQLLAALDIIEKDSQSLIV
jgi:hypothetical protein